jgi:hypothetical protein
MLRKIAHIIIAALIIVSSTGFTISAHYCHDQLIDLGLFSPAHSCCEKADHRNCNAGDALTAKSHCKDESIVVESTDVYVDSPVAFNFEKAPLMDLFSNVSILYNVQGSGDHLVIEPPWHKEPPPYREVVLSRIQTYLI